MTYTEQKLTRTIKNTRTYAYHRKDRESTWKELKKDNPNLKFYRSWHDVPLDLLAGARAIRLQVEVFPEPAAYYLTADNQTIYPLYKMVGAVEQFARLRAIELGVPFDPPFEVVVHVD